jgi:NAD(P)H-dependent FMN reductase
MGKAVKGCWDKGNCEGGGSVKGSNATYHLFVFFCFFKIDVTLKITIESKFNSSLL